MGSKWIKSKFNEEIVRKWFTNNLVDSWIRCHFVSAMSVASLRESWINLWTGMQVGISWSGIIRTYFSPLSSAFRPFSYIPKIAKFFLFQPHYIHIISTCFSFYPYCQHPLFSSTLPLSSVLSGCICIHHGKNASFFPLVSPVFTYHSSTSF